MCPLCGSYNINKLEVLAWRDLQALYRSEFQIRIPDEVEELQLMCCVSCDLQWYSPQIAGGEAFYEALQLFDWYYLPDKAEFISAARRIKLNDSVLEVGCGGGAFARHIKGTSYTGLELSQSAVNMAEACGLDVRQQRVEEHAALCKEAYSVVCAFQVLEHVPNVKSFVDGLLNCLKEGGLLILSVPSEDAMMSQLTNNVLNMPPHHVTRWTDLCLKNLTKLFPLEFLSLEHEPLSVSHARDYAIAQVQHYIRTILGRPKKHLDVNFSKPFVRQMIRAASLPLELFYQRVPRRPLGHSVTAYFRKRV